MNWICYWLVTMSCIHLLKWTLAAICSWFLENMLSGWLHCQPCSYMLVHVFVLRCGMMEFFGPLRSSLQQQCAQFFSWAESITSDQDTTPLTLSPSQTPVPGQVKQLLVDVLFAVQQVMVSHQERLKTNERLDEDDYVDTPFYKSLHEACLKDISNMNTHQVTKS